MVHIPSTVWADAKELIHDALTSWPLLVGAVSIGYRRHIAGLLDRIKSFKTPLGEAEIAEQKPVAAIGAKALVQPVLHPAGGVLYEIMLRELQKWVEQNIKPDERYQRLMSICAGINVEHIYLQVYTGIFGSQIHALQTLISGPLPKEAIKTSSYDRAAQLHPEAYKAQTFDRWLEFLILNNLVHLDGDNCSLTPLGREFLTFVTSRGLSPFKQF